MTEAKLSEMRLFLTALLGMIVLAMNLRLMAPTITAGDSAELSTAQSSLGIAHSPGYPLFVLAGKAFSELLPFGGPAYRTNGFSACLSAFCAMLAVLFLLVWTDSAILSLGGAFALISLPVIREQFLTTEVFALNFFLALVLLFLLSLILSLGDPTLKNKVLCLAYFVLGLGLGSLSLSTLVAAVNK